MTANTWDAEHPDEPYQFWIRLEDDDDQSERPRIAIPIRANLFDDDDDQEPELPDVLPILPLRGTVVFPQTAIPLTVGQPRSIRLVDDVASSNRLVGLFAAVDPALETPTPDQIHTVGTLAQIHRLFRAPDGTIRLLVQGLSRIEIVEYTNTEPYLQARVISSPEQIEDGLEIEALMRTIVDQFTRLSDLMPNLPTELITSALNLDDPLQLVYTVATYVRLELEEQQDLLEMDDIELKLKELMSKLNKELEVLELGHKIQNEAQGEMEKMQRDYFLREQLKAIQRELGEGDEQFVEIEEFREKIARANMPEEAEKEALRELDRLSKLPTAAAEYGVIRTYLDWMTTLPWDERTTDNLDITNARDVLNEDHYGLEDIKDRILEYLSVRKLRQERKDRLESNKVDDMIRRRREGAILAFVGPPGVGKTSLGASIARAMERKFIRMSLGGVRDEAEIRGFRRTYVGAMPGRIVQTLRRGGSRNPVIMLDEIDKLGRDFRGDPASALLEVLDPEQNDEFRDHYLDVAFDLSEVIFITTANELDPIPRPLLDRMEVIELSGYTEQEKLQIAKQYLIPRQIEENGLFPEEVSFTDDAILEIIQNYTREAGVRNLERQIGKVARKIATRIAEGNTNTIEVNAAFARELLKHPPYGYRTEISDRVIRPGVATGLAWTPVGGDILFIEATRMDGKGQLQLTGQLGDIMQESARAALSYLRTNAADFELPAGYFERNDLHLHVPAGAIPKDGPSAGIAITTALASLMTGRLVRRNIAMTGEVTLHGQVLPVGGIKDKVLAAHRMGLDMVILPKRNEPDLDKVPEEVRNEMRFRLVQTIDAALDVALEPVPFDASQRRHYVSHTDL